MHKAFGPSVTLAPAKKLADGSESVPWSKLSPEEQSKINAQLVQEQLKAATLLTANLGTAAGLESSGKEPAGTSAKSAEDVAMPEIPAMRRAIELLPVEPRKSIDGRSRRRKSIIRNGLFRMITLGLHLHSRCNRNRWSQAASTM